MHYAARCFCALAFLAGAAQLARAQVITSGTIERGLSFSGPISNGYVPFSERYFYGTGPYIYINGDAQRLRYLDYLDRVERAEKFGYAMPADPFQAPAEPSPAVRGFIGGGGGFGFFRRR